MGVGVSHWGLARAVAQAGQMGVVSGVALGEILARRLQAGDPGGHVRRALAQFPYPAIAADARDRYFIEGGKAPSTPFQNVPMFSLNSPQRLIELTVLGNFVEVFLAREGHAGLVGINYLEKINLPTLPSLYGAMLAGVDYVLMGAGIPMAIPGILDQFSRGEAAKLSVDIEGPAPGDTAFTTFDPSALFGVTAPPLKRPNFLPIISSNALATAMARKASGRVDGFIVEGSSAGGHNAPPRGPMQLSAQGEPVYGPRDLPDLEKIRALGLPFWLAGSYADPEQLAKARQCGATGVQVGTAFAFCEESGVDPDLRRRVLAAARAGTLSVFTDPRASPTGFPLKVLRLEGTVSEPDVYAGRHRVCDLGYLRHLYRRPDGSIGYRCPSESIESYTRKGGTLAETEGRRCVCNGLVGTIGLPQTLKDGSLEPSLITAGDDALRLARFLKPGASSYHAADVIAYLLGPPAAAASSTVPNG